MWGIQPRVGHEPLFTFQTLLQLGEVILHAQKMLGSHSKLWLPGRVSSSLSVHGCLLWISMRQPYLMLAPALRVPLLPIWFS